MLFRSLLGLAGLFAKLAAADRLVFAHYIVGLTSGQTRDEWQLDISQAKASGIDGFALNIGSQDSYNDEQLHLAYDVASSNGFSMFLSFDMQASQWNADQISSYINTYSGFSSQLRINAVPVVSTFEGPSQADIWPGVRSATGGIFLMPDWASLGAQGVGDKLSLIDGAFNWGAWPEANQLVMSTGNDVAYKSVLQGKPYMMGVSPYFYTNLPSKNWYSSSDSLWFDRWKQVFDIMPEYIEIITWNDYGESSYINAPISHQVIPDATAYVNGFDHTAFRFVLPYFISAYKAGNANVAVPAEGAVAWYRTTPATICSDGGTVWGQGGSASAAGGTKDVVSIIALTNAPTDINVKIGSGDAGRSVSATSTVGKASFYNIPTDGRTGAVTITLNGKSTTGPEITNNCPSSGHVNFNAVTIQV
ncbi:glycoside hydrolase family 71 protein [Xylaria bambusicola]|uniref:glycoside hydrolase family 71 protein n=1 Tax=Xylaria bambusicola TaxID=326684 RepID=UPI0020080690|nr:glycoside hydrolase family 71 protein [Xylaria bambusicola]KAI0517920.1 glycoside hydrolase family 71 protein [Xylaria bambusicola]